MPKEKSDIEKVRDEMKLRAIVFNKDPDKIKSSYELGKYVTALENLEVVAKACTDSLAKVDVLTILQRAIAYYKKVLGRI